MLIPEEQLQVCRSNIKVIDEELHQLLTLRYAQIAKIGQIKAQLGIPVYNAQVEQDLLDAIDSKSVTGDFIKVIQKNIMDESKKIQSNIIRDYCTGVSRATHNYSILTLK